MRKYLLPEKGTYYKANLHSHSKLSDGHFTVEQMKEEYKKRGYSILATSDHDSLRNNYHLSEKDFLILTSYEISIRSDDDGGPHAFRKVVDLNFISKDPHSTLHIGYHPDTVTWLVERGAMTQEEMDNIQYTGDLRDQHYYIANVNKIIRSANENGYLVSLNHPSWSCVPHGDYASFEGAWAVEIYNHGCYSLAGLPDAESVYDEILRSGKKIHAVATDDNHDHISLNPRIGDAFGGFTMIKADSLDYDSVISALEQGNFYASTGPEIHELYYEDGKVHIECSPCDDICMVTLGRRGKRVASEDGSLITSADFAIDKELFGYVRFRITDAKGKKAWTNTYYVDELDPSATPKRFIQ